MSLLAETKFGLSLLKQSPADESYVISPLSISLALALLHSGAKGSTKKQIEKALADGESDSKLVKYYKSLSENLLKESVVLVRIANRMFIRQGFEVKQSYIDDIGKNYAAKAEILDFSKGEECKEVVNGFVDEVTAGKIKEIVKADDFKDINTILVNALYFDAEWNTFFNSQSTTEGDFHVKLGVTKKVMFMKQYSSWDGKHAKNADCHVLTLDYKDRDYKFSILLPRKKWSQKNGLTGFRESLTAGKLQSHLKSVKDSWLNIVIPKFKIEAETDLKEMLEKIGIKEIFGENAKLDGIANGLSVSEIKHKAFIEVDESGTRAAAVTYDCLKQCNMTFPHDFKVDRPFLYVLSYKNHVIFSGQYCGS